MQPYSLGKIYADVNGDYFSKEKGSLLFTEVRFKRESICTVHTRETLFGNRNRFRKREGLFIWSRRRKWNLNQHNTK